MYRAMESDRKKILSNALDCFKQFYKLQPSINFDRLGQYLYEYIKNAIDCGEDAYKTEDIKKAVEDINTGLELMKQSMAYIAKAVHLKASEAPEVEAVGGNEGD